MAQTKKGAVAVVDADEAGAWTIGQKHAAEVVRFYEDIRSADAAGVPYPVVLAAAEALGIEYANELDV